MTAMVFLSVVDIVLLIAGLAFFLFVLGTQLARIATNLEECAELVRTIRSNAEVIRPSLPETGFEWIAQRRHFPVLTLLCLVALSALLLRTAYGWRVAAGLFDRREEDFGVGFAHPKGVGADDGRKAAG